MSLFSESDFYKIGTLIDFETELYDSSSTLYKLLVSDALSENMQFEIELCEVFSLFCKWDYFIKTEPNFDHMDFSALSRDWTDLYLEMKDAVLEGDERSVSHLSTCWETYNSQHNAVDQMLRSTYTELKKVYL